MGKFNYTTNITGYRSTSVRQAIYRRSSPKDCCKRPQYRMGKPTPAPPTPAPPTPAPPTPAPPTPAPVSYDISFNISFNNNNNTATYYTYKCDVGSGGVKPGDSVCHTKFNKNYDCINTPQGGVCGSLCWNSVTGKNDCSNVCSTSDNIASSQLCCSSSNCKINAPYIPVPEASYCLSDKCSEILGEKCASKCCKSYISDYKLCDDCRIENSDVCSICNLNNKNCSAILGEKCASKCCKSYISDYKSCDDCRIENSDVCPKPTPVSKNF